MALEEILIRLLIDKTKIRSPLLLLAPVVLVTVKEMSFDSAVHGALYSFVLAHTRCYFAAKPQILKRGRCSGAVGV